VIRDISMTRVYFVRHAEPNYDNHDDLLRELSPRGMEDRKLVTAFLSDKDIDVVLSSPFKRAIDTVADFAEKKGLSIEKIENFRERKVDSCWIEDFTEFTKRQWSDFNYKLSDGECLREVQDRNIAALNEVLVKYQRKNIVIGSHGTALSTIINYYDKSFGYEDFEKIRFVMPWIVEFVFDDARKCVEIKRWEELKR
jgi:2,3-bisphosphoglycerate-dependent phosphoglycerate mutase